MELVVLFEEKKWDKIIIIMCHLVVLNSIYSRVIKRKMFNIKICKACVYFCDLASDMIREVLNEDLDKLDADAM